MPDAGESRPAKLDYERQKRPPEPTGTWFVWVIFALGVCVAFAMVAAMLFVQFFDH